MFLKSSKKFFVDLFQLPKNIEREDDEEEEEKETMEEGP